MDSLASLPPILLYFLLSFNSIEWIREGVVGLEARLKLVPFNSIEWILRFRDRWYSHCCGITFNSIEWIPTL